MSSDLKRGDLVWAKMRGCSPWPGRIVAPRPDIKKPVKKTEVQFIRFFGSNDYAWIDDINVKPYIEFKSTFVNSCKLSSFKKAVADIEDFIKKQKDDPDLEMDSDNQQEDDFDKLKEEEKSPKKRKVSAIKRQRTSSVKAAAKKRRRDSDDNGSSPAFGNHISSRSFEEGHARSSMLEAQSPSMEVSNGSDAMKNRTVEASTLTFGFLGLGAMGSGIVKNLIFTGHRVNIWNRTTEKAEKFKEEAEIEHPGLVGTYSTPCDVVQNSDIIFCCVSDPAAVKDIVHGEFGVLHNSLEGKGYVEMTTIDTETSMYICNLITGKGGRYLEAQLQGSQQEAGDRNLIVLVAGNKTLYDDCYSCFKAIGHTVYYLGAVGFATKLNLVLQVIKGVALAGLTEAIALATRSGVAAKDVLEVFNLTNVASPYLKKKAELIVDAVEEHGGEKPLDHMQKDTKLALQLADTLKQPLLMTATANELYKHNRELSLQNER